MAFVSNGDIKIQACRYRPCEGVAFIQSLLSFLVQTSRLVELTEPFGLAHLEPAEAGRERRSDTRNAETADRLLSFLKGQIRLNLI